eukprot:scaffold174820_cov28-Tisochrysis_lutea.AAC.1
MSEASCLAFKRHFPQSFGATRVARYLLHFRAIVLFKKPERQRAAYKRRRTMLSPFCPSDSSVQRVRASLTDLVCRTCSARARFFFFLGRLACPILFKCVVVRISFSACLACAIVARRACGARRLLMSI